MLSTRNFNLDSLLSLFPLLVLFSAQFFVIDMLSMKVDMPQAQLKTMICFSTKLQRMKNWADEKGEQYNEIQEQDKWLVEFQAKNRKKN